MGLEASWSLADIPSNARDAAKAAALREGLSIGEWLTRRILKRFSEMTSREQEEAFNDLAVRLGELKERLEHIENRSHTEPMRDAVKKLHQGMERLSEELVQTAGRSTIQLSTLQNTVDSLNSAIEEIRAEAGKNTDLFEQRVAELRESADSQDLRYGDAARTLTSRLDSMAESVDDVRARALKFASSAERRTALLEQGLHDLDTRMGEALKALTSGIEAVAARLEDTRKDATVSSASLDGRTHTLQRAVDGLDLRQSEHSQKVAESIEMLGGRIDEIRSGTSGIREALDYRIPLIQQSLQALDSRHGETAEAFSRNQQSLASRVENIWAKMSAARTTIEERIANTERSVGDINLQQKEALQSLSEARSLEATTSAAIVDLENSVAELKERMAEMAANGVRDEPGNAVSELKKSLFDRLEHDAQNHQEMLAALRSDLLAEAGNEIMSKLKAVRDEVSSGTRKQQEAFATFRSNMLGEMANLVAVQIRSLREEFQQTAQEQRQAIASLGPSLFGESAKAFEVKLEFALQKQQETAVVLRSDVLQETENLIKDAIDDSGRNQQSALAEARISVIDEVLRAVSDKFEAETRAHQESFADLRASVLDEAVKALGLQLEAEGRKQQDALAELKSSLLDLLTSLGERLDADEKNQEEAITRLRADLTPAPVEPADAAHEMLAEKSRPDETAAPASSEAEVSRHQVFELSAPLDEQTDHQSAASLHTGTASVVEPESEATRSVLASDPEPAIVLSQPATAFARDESGSQTPPPPHTYLSAARQSLQVEALRHDGNNGSKDLFASRFFRPSEFFAKGKGETTSYALLAGIVLVAFLAVVIAVGQFVGRSAPARQTRSAVPSVAATSSAHVAKERAVGRKLLAGQRASSGLDMQSDPARLATAAGMGNAQAQLLLGLHDLGGNNADAAKWLAQAAAQGQAEAQYRLGALYAAGHGVKADLAMALRWYQAAANAGNRRAMFNVALAFAQGQGTAKNPEEAARWFEKAAQLGLIDAQFNLAILYERGLGVPQSLIDAYRWYAIAAKAGDRESKDRIEALASQLSATDRATADVAAARFVPIPMNAKANPAP